MTDPMDYTRQLLLKRASFVEPNHRRRMKKTPHFTVFCCDDIRRHVMDTDLISSGCRTYLASVGGRLNLENGMSLKLKGQQRR